MSPITSAVLFAKADAFFDAADKAADYGNERLADALVQLGMQYKDKASKARVLSAA